MMYLQKLHSTSTLAVAPLLTTNRALLNNCIKPVVALGFADSSGACRLFTEMAVSLLARFQDGRSFSSLANAETPIGT